MPFVIASETIQCLGINLTKKVKNLYTENCKTLMKEIKKKQINENISQVLGLEELIWLNVYIT